MNSKYKTVNRFHKEDLRSASNFSKEEIAVELSRLANEDQKQASFNGHLEDKDCSNFAKNMNASDNSVSCGRWHIDVSAVGVNSINHKHLPSERCASTSTSGCDGERWKSDQLKYQIHELRRYVSTMTNQQAKERLRNFLEIYSMVKIYLTVSEREKEECKEVDRVTEAKGDYCSEKNHHFGDDATKPDTSDLTAAENADKIKDNYLTDITDSLVACSRMRPPQKLRSKFVLTKDPFHHSCYGAQCENAFERNTLITDVSTVGECAMANAAWFKIMQLNECLRELETEEQGLLAEKRSKKLYLKRRKRELRKHEGNRLSKQQANQFKTLKQLYYSETMSLIEGTKEKIDEMTCSIRQKRAEDMNKIQVRLPAVSAITKAAIQLQSTVNRSMIGQLVRRPELGGRDDQLVLATLGDLKNYVQSMVNTLTSMSYYVTSLPSDAAQGQQLDKALEEFFMKDKKACMDDVCCRTYAFYELKKLTASTRALALAIKDKLVTLEAVTALDTTLSSTRNNMIIHRLKCHCLLGDFSTCPEYPRLTVNSLPPTKISTMSDDRDRKLGVSVSDSRNNTPGHTGGKERARALFANRKTGVFCSYSDTSTDLPGLNRNHLGGPARSHDDYVRRLREEHALTFHVRCPVIGRELTNTREGPRENSRNDFVITKQENQTTSSQPVLHRLGLKISDSEAIDEGLGLLDTDVLYHESPGSSTSNGNSSPISCYTSSEGDLRDKMIGFTNWVYVDENEERT